RYRLNLILYFDKVNGVPGAKDFSVNARIFRKRDNAVMISLINLPLVRESAVSYTQPECSNGEIVTDKLGYSREIELSDDQFSDPAGYYVVWERCCRNYEIRNVVSSQPNAPNFQNFAGQTFYLEFPPVTRNGEPFVNSTPRLFPPLNDYACPFKPYYVNFGGFDDDGDSLAYSLVEPLNTFSAQAIPPGGPNPAPYPVVQWRIPFSFNNILGGAPDLRISREGFLTATPTVQGLFVFSVKCEEYRDGVKLGEVRRDFQILVVDQCPDSSPTSIVGKGLDDATFDTDGTLSVTFDNDVSDADRCIQVRVSDPDASKQTNNLSERVTLRAIPLNFKGNVDSILPDIKSTVLTNGSSADFTICFDRCPLVPGGVAQIGILAFDDACPLPLYDTLKVNVNIEPPDNSDPLFVTSSSTIVELNEGDAASWNIEIRDADLDPLLVNVVTDGFVLANAGMRFTVLQQEPGLVRARLDWDAFCDIYDFTRRTNFVVGIVVNDVDECNRNNPVRARYSLAVRIPGNADPLIDTDLTANPLERKVLGITRKINEQLRFAVRGEDLVDNDLLVLTGEGRGFNLTDYGISFSPATARGQASSVLQWNLTCSTVNLKERDTFELRFIVVDNANKCRFYKADTVDVEVKILPPDNAEPWLTVLNTDQSPLISNLNLTLGEPIALTLVGTDADRTPQPDQLTLELISATGTVPPQGFTFAPASGQVQVQSQLLWSPDCSIFENGVYEHEYDFVFRLADDRCYNASADTVAVKIRLADIVSTDAQFLPPNVFTPNNDGCNDYFALEGIEPSTCGSGEVAFQSFLPLDNCINQFQAVRIYNRWGERVFESTDRTFRWYAKDQPPGVYYYYITFSQREYKGSVSIHY
ncbi:MAG: gliding motility-associated C-terminal domain-containing protein, partial [Cyclobacteriaceae bacterium]